MKKIDIQFSAGEQRALALDGERQIGFASYFENGKIRVLDHTFVEPEYNGRGIAGQLVDRVIDEARQAGFKVLPQCPYAVARMDKYPERYADVRAITRK